jgi:hypothetical protein
MDDLCNDPAMSSLYRNCGIQEPKKAIRFVKKRPMLWLQPRHSRRSFINALQTKVVA